MRRLTRTLALLAVGGLMVSAAAGCATQAARGACADYTPTAACSPGFTSTCEVTADGCEQCACVPTADDGGRSPYLGPR